MCEEMSAEPKKLMPPSRNNVTAPKIVARAADQSKIVDRYTSNNNNSNSNNACARNFRDNSGGGGNGGGSTKWDNRHSAANWGGRKGGFGEKYRRGGQQQPSGGGRRASEAALVHQQASGGYEEAGQQVASKKSASAAADLGSVFRPGSKKGVLAEFLSFSYESPLLKRSQFYRQFTYEEPNGSYLRNVNNVYARSSSSSSTAYYNKEQYLQANCQFIMNDAYDYGPHLADPDLLVDWNCVEEIRFLDNECPSCPICLYPPIAAQITRCGHVFCWPCILHYLALSDKQWRRCPICYESIYKNQLKSVRSIKAERYTEEKQITLRLMRREKGSNLALPVSCWREKHNGVGKINDDFGRFAKLLVTDTEEIRTGVIGRERAELEKQLAEESEAPESCFIREALETLQEREKTLRAAETFREMSGPVHTNRSPPSKSQMFHMTEDRQSVEIFTDAFNEISSTLESAENFEEAPGASKKEAEYSSSTSESSSSHSNHEESMVAAASVCLTTAVDYANHPCTEKSYYFYQSDDGQPLFLHPLNVHCLIREYGALELSPETVSGTVSQIETFTMCPETRKRYRYLGHLPLSSVFSLLELRFADNVVSEDTVEHFADQFEKRRRMRLRKEKDAQRLQKQAERWERAMMLNAPNASKYPPTMSPDEFPISTFVQSAQSEIQAACLNQDVNNVDAPVAAAAAACSSTSNMVPGSPDDQQQRSLSFAQMLRQGKPRLSAPAAIGQSTAAAASSMTSSDSHGPIGGCDEEDGEYAPLALSHYRSEFGDALQAAFDSLKTADDSDKPEPMIPEESNDGSKNQNNRGKMKKKKKGKILFTL